MRDGWPAAFHNVPLQSPLSSQGCPQLPRTSLRVPVSFVRFRPGRGFLQDHCALKTRTVRSDLEWFSLFSARSLLGAPLMKRRLPHASLMGSAVSLTQIIISVTVPLIGLAAYFAWCSRRQCPYRSPLCRSSKPCILCYRDLFKNSVAKGGTE